MADLRYSGDLDQVKTASGLNILAGLWVVVAPFLLNFHDLQAAVWNSAIVGIAIAAMAGYRVANPNLYPGLSWANAALGAWLIVAPFALAFQHLQMPLWNHVIAGLIVACLGAWSALATPGHARPTGR